MSGQQLRHLLMIALRTMAMYLCYFPVLLIAGHFMLAGQTVQLAILLMGGSLAGILVGAIPMKVYAEVLISLVLSGAATLSMFGMRPRSFIAFALLYAMIHLGMRCAQNNPEDVLSSRVLALGLATYLLVPIFYRLDPFLQDMAAWHLGIGVAAIAAAFFLLNRMQLALANLQDRAGTGGVAPDIRLKNTLYVMALLLVVLVTANIKAISRWLDMLRERFVSWLNQLPRTPGERMETPVDPELPMLPIDVPVTEERSPFWAWLQEMFVYVVSGLIIFALIGAIGYLVATQLVPLLRRVIGGLNRERQRKVDYRDETERLERPDLRDLVSRTFGRIKVKRPVLPDDPRERVRMRYRLMLEAAAKDGLPANPAWTPTETAEALEARLWRKKPASLLVRLYNPVRYGAKDVDPQELAELEQAWDGAQDGKRGS